MYLGDYTIGNSVPFNFQALDGDGLAVDPDNTPTYEVYVNNAPMDTPVTGTMSKIDGQTGFYGGTIAATAVNGFVAGSTYTIRISATIDAVPTLTTDTFQVSASSVTTVSATVTDTTEEENTLPVNADTPFDAALINANAEFKQAFGLTITVYPDGVTARSVTAIIDYNGITAVPGMPQGHSYDIAISLDNNNVTGLSADEFNTALATCEVPKKKGATASSARIVKILTQDAAQVQYEVR